MGQEKELSPETQRVIDAATIVVGEYARALKAGLINPDERLTESFEELLIAIGARNLETARDEKE